ncbi:flagellar export chaperone FliS [Shouchella shacheensis]|uniref:flagellar export chaperone FliS n=1 Tax=Shouchella shacheensis TaxID=1649580 RepID=UPI00074012B0|nr:flagellar export chaperone FliS [Shouchella shacheensis]
MGAFKQAAYKQQSIQTASPGELTLMLYNGCLTQLKQAKRALEAKDIEARHLHIGKAETIIRELMVTLKQDAHIAGEMLRMYEYILHQLIEANVKQDEQALDEAILYVTEFRDTWKQVIQRDRQNRYSAGGGHE